VGGKLSFNVHTNIIMINTEKGNVIVLDQTNLLDSRILPFADSFKPGKTRLKDIKVVVDDKAVNLIDYLISIGELPESFKHQDLSLEHEFTLLKTQEGIVIRNGNGRKELYFDPESGQIVTRSCCPAEINPGDVVLLKVHTHGVAVSEGFKSALLIAIGHGFFVGGLIFMTEMIRERTGSFRIDWRLKRFLLSPSGQIAADELELL